MVADANRADLARFVLAGLVTGVVDGLFSSILNVVAYGSTVSRLFQGVASVLLGREAFDGGTRTAAIGVLMHFGVAFAWSALSCSSSSAGRGSAAFSTRRTAWPRSPRSTGRSSGS